MRDGERGPALGVVQVPPFVTGLTRLQPGPERLRLLDGNWDGNVSDLRLRLTASSDKEAKQEDQNGGASSHPTSALWTMRATGIAGIRASGLSDAPDARRTTPTGTRPRGIRCHHGPSGPARSGRPRAPWRPTPTRPPARGDRLERTNCHRVGGKAPIAACTG